MTGWLGKLVLLGRPTPRGRPLIMAGQGLGPEQLGLDGKIHSLHWDIHKESQGQVPREAWGLMSPRAMRNLNGVTSVAILRKLRRD
jgi:hypothetical protein